MHTLAYHSSSTTHIPGPQDGWYTLAKLSEEHAFVDRANESEIPSDMRIDLGSLVRIFPNHSCPVANLAHELIVSDGQRVLDRWTVAASQKYQ